MQVMEYQCESYDEVTRQWVASRFFYTLEEIERMANSRPLLDTGREGERAGRNEWGSHSTGFPGPAKEYDG